ncbi:MAG: hypothetical protein ACI9AT_001255 [Ulvibacter sp.]|jgi:hypothetical protein
MELKNEEVKERLECIFMPRLAAEKARLLSDGNRFIHYTTAENALNIIKSRELWMRSPACMNDYMEISHGHGLLVKFFQETEYRKTFTESIDQYQVGLAEDILNGFDLWWEKIRNYVFIASVSEHPSSEDKHGRLSMWRAYGSQEGKAGLVLNNPPKPSFNLGVILSPALYYTRDDLTYDLLSIAELVDNNIDYLKTLKRETILGTVITSLIIYAVCLKHPGFSEEREWRLIFLPNMLPENKWVKKSIETIGGIPQIVYKMPLQNSDELDITGLSIPELLESIIIGPSQYPLVLFDAFNATLVNEDISGSDKIIVVSDIPLRT